MRIDAVQIRGWMPFADELRLELPAGPIAVVGMHGEDARRSNRAGKTALLEAITWCLFGTHRKRLEDQVINEAVSSCEVVVELGEMKVTRSRTRGSATKLCAHISDRLRERHEELTGAAAQRAIEKNIGLVLADYLATSCFPQGDVEAIISRSPSERLALVSDWLQQSRWLEARAIQVKKTSAANAALGEKRGARANAEKYLLDDKQRAALMVELGSCRSRIAELEVEIGALSDKLLETAAAQQQLVKHQALKTSRSIASELRTSLRERASVEKEKARLLEEEAAARSAADAAKATLDETATVRETGFSGQCPVMCAECPVAETVTATVREATELYNDRMRAYQEELHKVRLARDAVGPVARKVVEFERQAARYQALVDTGKKLASELTMTEDEARSVPSGDEFKQKLDELQRQMSNVTQRAGEIAATIESADKNEEQHRHLVNDVLRAEIAAQVSYLAQRAISAIPARIAAQQLSELESETNLILEGTGVSISFSLWRELADWAPTCEECGFVYESKRAGKACPRCSTPREKKRAQELEILCDDGSGVVEDVRFNSGGTRDIVGSAIRLAASSMLRRLRDSRAAWAIVDEPFGSLDAENRELLARAFAGMLSAVGLEQALVVSHDQQLLAALPSRIVVTKNGASSTARVE